jgi:mycothiol synthase
VVTLRAVETDAEYDAWRQVRIATLPNERTASIEEMRNSARPDLLILLAVRDERVVGSGIAGRSDLAGAGFVAPRVLPAARRQGIGTALLRALVEHVASLGLPVASASVEDPESLAFAESSGFREVDRQVEQVRAVRADEPAARVPDGVQIVPVSERPELWVAAYESVAPQAFADMANIAPLEASIEEWERDWISAPEAMFVAVADGQVIGHPHREHQRAGAATAGPVAGWLAGGVVTNRVAGPS